MPETPRSTTPRSTTPNAPKSVKRRTRRRFWRILLLTVGVLILLGSIYAGFFWNVMLPGSLGGSALVFTLPAPTGSYRVGRQCFDWTDTSRVERFDRSHKRQIMVWIWYPASPSRKAKPGRYLPGPWGRAAAKWNALDLHLHTHSLLSALTHSPTMSSTAFEQLQAHSVDNAPLLEGQQRFPVLLFEPGLGQMPTDYTCLLEEIASHGYIVVGINPTYFSWVTVFSDGRQVGRMPIRDILTTDLKELFPTWVKDMTFALDQMATLNSDPQSPYFARLDLNHVGAFGHSFGGAAAASACHEDERIKAAMDIDGGSPRGKTATWQLSKPLMLLQSDHEMGTRPKTYTGPKKVKGPIYDRDADQLYQAAQVGYLIIVKGATHHDFMDQAVFALSRRERETLLGTIPGQRMVQITGSYTRAFFDTYLRNRASPLLHGPSETYPEIQFRKHDRKL